MLIFFPFQNIFCTCITYVMIFFLYRQVSLLNLYLVSNDFFSRHVVAHSGIIRDLNPLIQPTHMPNLIYTFTCVFFFFLSIYLIYLTSCGLSFEEWPIQQQRKYNLSIVRIKLWISNNTSCEDNNVSSVFKSESLSYWLN